MEPKIRGVQNYKIVSRSNASSRGCSPMAHRHRSGERRGLNQILEMEDLVSESGAAPASAQDELALEFQGLGQDQWCFPQFGGALPAIMEKASLLGRQISDVVAEAVVGDQRANSGETEDGPIGLNVELASTSELSVGASTSAQLTRVPSSGRGSNGTVSDIGILSNLAVDRAASIFSATSAAVMEMGQSMLTTPPAVWQGLVARVQTTLRGSADDIGWLQKDPNLPPVKDGTERFAQLLGRISNGVHSLPDTLVYLLIPGLFSNHGPLYFVDTKKYFSRLGLACYIARIHSEAAVETNAKELKDYITELYWGTGKRVILLGHSKGGVDAAAALAMYWSDLKDKVVGLVLAQSPYGGSPIASDILREGQIADTETRRIMEVLICRIIKGDMRSLEDLTYDRRREFLATHPLPTSLPTVSFHTEASRAPSVISTMSHIAHAELPWLPMPSTPTNEDPVTGAKLPVAIPLAAAMAICALHLDLRYGEQSDGLVARKDAEVPGSVVVRPDKKLDHAWMVYAPSRKEAKDVDSSQVCEALLTLLLEEAGKVQNQEEEVTTEQGNAETL